MAEAPQQQREQQADRLGDVLRREAEQHPDRQWACVEAKLREAVHAGRRTIQMNVWIEDAVKRRIQRERLYYVLCTRTSRAQPHERITVVGLDAAFPLPNGYRLHAE
jgi:hypothetical protein